VFPPPPEKRLEDGEEQDRELCGDESQEKPE
jgi:hypothetical protein